MLAQTALLGRDSMLGGATQVGAGSQVWTLRGTIKQSM